MELLYGGYFPNGAGFSVPIATIVEGAEDSGMSLVLSPEDTLLDVRLKTNGEGSVTFLRLKNRISKEKRVRFARDLIAHEGDWRPGLGWMVKRYPDYSNPATPTADQVAGGGAKQGTNRCNHLRTSV